MVTIPTLVPPPFPGIPPEPNPPTVSSAPAQVAYRYFGLPAPSIDRLVELTGFVGTQLTAYKQQGVARPELGPYEALGKALSDVGNFAGKFAIATTSDFVARAYSDIFQRNANSSQIDHFVSQVDYFTGLYKGAGVSGDAASLMAKGAVAGQMLGFAMLDEGGRTPYAAGVSSSLVGGFDFI